ncbi:MAG TPA: 4-hydroxythreonine-4-phosphate dehydrogenase PdxA [Planctomicrobium sp.]|nr:4-hydroxythreonine-4-phosphate dehydrogenase PdxA [Planctomicrobium sp.]
MTASSVTNSTNGTLPRIAVTMGDVAGIGPEIIARSFAKPEFRSQFFPVVVGDPDVLERAAQLVGYRFDIREIGSLDEFSPTPDDVENSVIWCWNPTQADTADVPPGRIDGRAGKAAYDWLVAATQAALAGTVDGIVTAPISKAALHAGGHDYPGHTEILAEQCGVDDFAMMLYLPLCSVIKGPYGLSVAHVTLHTSIASVPGLLSQQGIQEKIQLMNHFLRRIGCPEPRIGVCALNPHAGEEGLFGDEESRIIAPAVMESRQNSIAAEGPFPADTLLQRAVHGAFDGVIAMYHDQGHIALKLIAFQKAVNVTLGLPIVRTSPSHGTGFDISWRGMADDGGLQEATRVAIELCRRRSL